MRQLRCLCREWREEKRRLVDRECRRRTHERQWWPTREWRKTPEGREVCRDLSREFPFRSAPKRSRRDPFRATSLPQLRKEKTQHREEEGQQPSENERERKRKTERGTVRKQRKRERRRATKKEKGRKEREKERERKRQREKERKREREKERRPETAEGARGREGNQERERRRDRDRETERETERQRQRETVRQRGRRRRREKRRKYHSQWQIVSEMGKDSTKGLTALRICISNSEKTARRSAQQQRNTDKRSDANQRDGKRAEDR